MSKVVFSIRVDKRIKDKLDSITRDDDKSRNRLIEQVLAEKCGVLLDPLYTRDDDDD